ncbi:caldesmon-like [Procambarus clarkii]|uniref:caldesmon-like n=1 Tax=Procambarus clarkii TaxID=6728 RepID=UPI003743ED3D
MTAVLNFRGSEKDLARAQKYIDTGDDEILQNCTQEQLWLIGKMYGVRLKSNRASSKRKEIKAIMQIDRVSMFCKTRDEKILDMCTRRQIRMLEDHFGLKGRHDKVEDGREALRTWLREQKAEEEKEAKRQCEQEETQCQQGGAEALPQNEVPDRLEEISEETDDAPSDEGINVNSSSSRESSLERREVEPKLEPGDNEVQLQREERQARLEQEKAKAEQERAKAEQEKAKAEQEKAKAEQEKLKVGQERAKAEQETAKAELAMIKMEAAKAERERIKTARRENRVRGEARCSNSRPSGVWGGRNYERPRRVGGEKNFDKSADKSKYPKTQKSRSRTSSESEDGGAKREANRYLGNQESNKAPQSDGKVMCEYIDKRRSVVFLLTPPCYFTCNTKPTP